MNRKVRHYLIPFVLSHRVPLPAGAEAGCGWVHQVWDLGCNRDHSEAWVQLSSRPSLWGLEASSLTLPLAAGVLGHLQGDWGSELSFHTCDRTAAHCFCCGKLSTWQMYTPGPWKVLWCYITVCDCVVRMFVQEKEDFLQHKKHEGIHIYIPHDKYEYTSQDIKVYMLSDLYCTSALMFLYVRQLTF